MFVSGINYTYMGTARLATLIKKRQTGIANFKDFDENRAVWSSTILLPTNKKKKRDNFEDNFKMILSTISRYIITPEESSDQAS